VTTHFDDEAQLEQLQRWWKENWLPLASGLALGLAAIFGWQAWTRHQDMQAGAASHLFEDLRRAVDAGKFDEAVPMAARLQQDFAGTPYAVDGQLKMAQAAFDDGKLDDASARLQWAEQNAKDDAMRSLVKLRLARVLWQQAKPDDALQLLNNAEPAYAPLVAELRGDILLAKGDRNGARDAYADALKTLAADSPARDGLQYKFDDLAVATVKS
jgi:predicted negative regulator of RcsB-dependent stress response